MHAARWGVVRWLLQFLQRGQNGAALRMPEDHHEPCGRGEVGDSTSLCRRRPLPGSRAPKEAYDKILDEIFPAYQAAEKKGDYLGIKEAAQQILDQMEGGGAATVRKHIEAEATSGRRASQRLGKLVKAETFAKNAEGLYDYKGGWYGARTHEALEELAEAVDDGRRSRKTRALTGRKSRLTRRKTTSPPKPAWK